MGLTMSLSHREDARTEELHNLRLALATFAPVSYTHLTLPTIYSV